MPRQPVPGELVRDRWLTRRWSGSRARLWTPVAAWLVDDTGRQIYVDDAPAGASIRIDEVWRVGPLTADLRVLGSPQVTPRLWLVASWHGLDLDPARSWAAAARPSRPRGFRQSVPAR